MIPLFLHRGEKTQSPVLSMELPYGWGNRHNTADPTAAVFSKSVVARSLSDHQRDEAVRRKYLSQTENGSDQTTAGETSLPIGWENRTATCKDVPSAAAIEVDWQTAKAVEVNSNTNVRNTPPTGQSGAGSLPHEQQTSKASQEAVQDVHTHRSYAKGHTRQTDVSSHATSQPEQRSTGIASLSTKQEMAAVVFRLHQIAQQEAALSKERTELLKKLSGLVLGS